MAEDTLIENIVWFTCLKCSSTYDVDYLENRDTCVCCGASLNDFDKGINDFDIKSNKKYHDVIKQAYTEEGAILNNYEEAKELLYMFYNFESRDEKIEVLNILKKHLDKEIEVV